jgi:hypothetical protein
LATAALTTVFFKGGIMALEKQLVPLPMDKGLDTKTDPKQEEVGYLRLVQNIVYETVKLFRKRNGYDLINLLDTDDNQIEGANTLSKYKDELILFNDTRLYSYSNGLNRFVDKGAVYPVATETRITFKSAASQTLASARVVDNFLVSAWVDSALGVRYSVQDLTNQSFLVSNDSISATGTNVTVCNILNTVYIVYTEGSNLTYKKFSILHPQNLTSPGAPIATNVDTSNLVLDSENYLLKVFIAYNSTVVGAKVALFSIDSADSISSILNITGSDGSNAIDISSDAQNRILLTYSGGTDIKTTIYSYTLSTPLLAPTTIETIADVLTCTLMPTTTGNYVVYYEVEGADPSQNYIKSNTLTLGGVVGTPSVFVRGMGLASKGFYVGDTLMVTIIHGSQFQSTYFVVDSSGAIVSKFANQSGGGLVGSGALSSVSSYGTGNYIIPGLFRNRLKSDNGVFFSTTGIAYAILDFELETKFRTAQLADALHICSGLLKMYDGNSVVEHGFNFFPENLTNPSTAGAGGNLGPGNYGYVATYRWADNTGKDHISAPSPQTLTVVIAAGTTNLPKIRVPTLRLTEKESVVIDIYRTEDAGTVFYKVTDDLNPVYNDTTVDYIEFDDAVADGVPLISREPLYTTGGVLENLPAPGSGYITVMKNRLAVIGESTNRVYFSKEISEDRPVEFTDQIYRDCDPSGGPITALASMDEKLIVFTQDFLFNIAGDGPTNTGEQDTFIQPELVSSDIGCTEPLSIVLTPSGIMFKSRKGIWQLGRGLDLTYIGDRVEAYNNNVITSAAVVGKLNQIRFTSADSDALVYNYHLDRWGTFDNHRALSAVTIKDQYYYLRTDNEIYKENVSSFSDASSTINMKFETGWLTLSELQGYQRVYHLLILGSYKTPHLMRVKIAYDFVDAWVQEEVIDPADFVTTTTYGQDSPYGAGSPYGGNGRPYQVQINLQRQKCTSVRISVEEAQNSVGAGLTISAITFRAGVKQGANKLSATQKVGTAQ